MPSVGTYALLLVVGGLKFQGLTPRWLFFRSSHLLVLYLSVKLLCVPLEDVWNATMERE